MGKENKITVGRRWPLNNHFYFTFPPLTTSFENIFPPSFPLSLSFFLSHTLFFGTNSEPDYFQTPFQFFQVPFVLLGRPRILSQALEAIATFEE